LRTGDSGPSPPLGLAAHRSRSATYETGLFGPTGLRPVRLHVDYSAKGPLSTRTPARQIRELSDSIVRPAKVCKHCATNLAVWVSAPWFRDIKRLIVDHREEPVLLETDSIRNA